MSDKKVIELARRMAELGQKEDACRAYILVIDGCDEHDAELELEAAMYILQSGLNYRIPYTSFCKLYNRRNYRDLCLGILTEAFYDPNKAEQEELYKANCSLLAEYPHLTRYDFPPFSELPIRFYPFDDHGYIPFFTVEECFGEYIDFSLPVIIPNFLYDIGKSISVSEVFSQEDINWLRGNLPTDQPVYFHYTDWNTFCSYLQVLDLRPLLENENAVFLIDNDKAKG